MISLKKSFIYKDLCYLMILWSVKLPAFALVNHACELLGDRLIGWDVCIGPEGPIIIEGNHNYHMVMQEVAYGGYRKHPDFIRVLAEENIRP